MQVLKFLGKVVVVITACVVFLLGMTVLGVFIM